MKPGSFLSSISVTALFLVTSAAEPAGQKKPSPRQKNIRIAQAYQGAGGESPAESLRNRVREHLREGHIEAALQTAQKSLTEFPENEAVRREFIELHVSLARGLMREENFTTAVRALRAVLKVDADHSEARRLIKTIDLARKDVAGRVEEAKRWVTLEWHESAFNVFRQACALLPDQKKTWIDDYRAASIGAGDDHYFTKNFHEAFYYYDAAIKLGETQETKATASLVSRWLQSMVHSLAHGANRTRYPPAYWKMVLKRAESMGLDDESGRVLLAMLRGLAHESLDAPDKAATEYSRVLGRPVVNMNAELVARSRQSALRSLRSLYDVRLSDRRRGFWSERNRGDWQLLEVPGFQIHHRNAEVARRTAEALRFHFVRIADLMALDLDEVPWTAPCDVHLYASEAEFQNVTGQAKQVQAISVIRKQGRVLQSHAIHAVQTDPLLLSASLPHELAHLIVGAVTNYRPFNAAINEGIALNIEPQCRHRQFARLFARIKKPRSITKLLEVKEVHPPTPNYYAESYRLMKVILSHRDISTALEIGQREMNRGKLAKMLGFESGNVLESAYRGRSE